ncbi:MAG TPA: hypothetical protein VM327_05865 [Candidatus Thermoplasmatota archaeon]|nr:hypothetical protein [Candidatus Thermoplasmatota archaeon]
MTTGTATVPRLAALALATLTFVSATSGCLEGLQGGGPRGCDADLFIGDVRGDAPQVGGPGPRAITVEVADAVGTPQAGAAVAAWWDDGGAGKLDAVLLRTGADGSATANVPAGAGVHLIAGDSGDDGDSWSHDGFVQAGQESLTVGLIGTTQTGSLDGLWSMPVAIGAQERVWDPHDLPWADADHLEGLWSLILVLEWENQPQGSADFGLALGHDDLDRYWNPEYQVSLGPEREILLLSLTDLEEFGLTQGDSLRAGPSISTGAYVVTPIPYTMSWQAEFNTVGDPGLLCDRYGDDATIEDVTGSGSDPAPTPLSSSTITVAPAARRLD